MYLPLNKPPQWLLDKLLQEEKDSATKPCPDCGAEIGHAHTVGCDVARCLVCKGQRLSCECASGEGFGDTWTGLWPGTQECYENGYVAYDTSTGTLCFDLNRLGRPRVSDKKYAMDVHQIGAEYWHD